MNSENNSNEQPIKKKRGRKPKNDPSKLTSTDVQPIEEKIPKKRGRKPKGGKIINKAITINKNSYENHNVILHLKCKISDLNNDSASNEIDSFNFVENKSNELNYHLIDNNTNNEFNNNNNNNNNNINNINNDTDDENHHNLKNIWKKIDKLAVNLHTNNISDKKSACFWCTCDFDNPPIYIPKYELNNSYHVYGCFCSPECGTAHLMNENIDSATKFERYHLLNHIYCKIYDYEKNIKPAPNPYYTLNKYYGNLSIQEYRRLLKNERLLLVVDKPLTRILPELHDDNDDFMINNTSIPAANKFQLRRKSKTQTKTNILNQHFNIT